MEKFAVLWCVENLLPSRMVRQGQCRQLVYEQCRADPDDVFGRLLGELGLTPSRSTRAAIGRRVSSPGQSSENSQSWHAPLSRREGERVMEFVAGFGLLDYAVPCGYPDSWLVPSVSSENMRAVS